MQDKTHLFETKKKTQPTHLEIGFSWNAAKHDLMSNACLSACLFKTHGFFAAWELHLDGWYVHDRFPAGADANTDNKHLEKDRF